MNYYAGIGSRQTPKSILAFMEKCAFELAKREWVLRSGGAPGADTAFERGCFNARGLYEIYLPWNKFNGHSGLNMFFEIRDDAIDSVYRWHPAPDKLSEGAFKLMARNYYQVMGIDGPPSRAILCWTPDGADTGGTSQAIRIARHHKIPVHNLFFETTRKRIQERLGF